jgi:hypothetical protein
MVALAIAAGPRDGEQRNAAESGLPGDQARMRIGFRTAANALLSDPNAPTIRLMTSNPSGPAVPAQRLSIPGSRRSNAAIRTREVRPAQSGYQGLYKGNRARDRPELAR